MKNMEVEIKYKKCTCCGMEFPATEEYWYKYKPGKYGLKATCKQCYKEKQRLYERTPEGREAKRRYRTKFKEVLSEKDRLRYHSDDLYRKRKNEKNIRWRKKNPEKCKDINKKIVNGLKSSYVANKMRRSVNDLTPEIIETQRLIIQLRRELKNNNVKIR